MKIRELKLEEIEWSIERRMEDLDPAESFDDPESVKDIHAKLDAGNPWAWCEIRVVGRWKGFDSDDYIGACSYNDENDFKQGGYYEDMQKKILNDLNYLLAMTVIELNELEIKD